MRKSSNAAGAKRVQYAALPYRLSGRSRTEVMLVASRETQRWIIPKGCPQRGRAPYDSAAREAFEEAGHSRGGAGERTGGGADDPGRRDEFGLTKVRSTQAHSG